MSTKTVAQLDLSGLFVAPTTAFESPLEPGVWHLPAGTVEELPPHEFNEAGEFIALWPDDKWPRWNGAAYDMVTRPNAEAAEAANDNDPVAKLRGFLAANPDVAALLQQGGV